MRIAVVDDQSIERKLLIKMLNNYMSEHEIVNVSIDSYATPHELLDDFHERAYNLIFLDIYMDHMDGVELARNIRQIDEEVRLIFCTSSRAHAQESYEVHASSYLSKPYTYEYLSRVLNEVLADSEKGIDSIILGDTKVIPRNILYTEYFNHKITIHPRVGDLVSVRMNQTQIENALSDYDFLVPCNRGIIVNIAMVKSLDDDSVIMCNKEVLPVSRGKYPLFKDALTRHQMKKLKKSL